MKPTDFAMNYWQNDVFSLQCPITSGQRHSNAAGSRDVWFYPTRSLAG